MKRYRFLFSTGLAILLLSLIFISGCQKNDDPVSNPTPSTNVSESDLLVELNLARTNPKLYASFIEATKKYYNGKNYEVPGEIPIVTQEGLPAVQEAIDFLSVATPCQALTLSVGLTKAARDHVADTGPKGLLGHTGSDGSSPVDRMNRYGTWNIAAGENIAYGPKTARDVLIQLIIDDGNPDRGHRQNIYDNDYKVVGVAFGSHKQFSTMSVQDFAGAYTEK